MARDGLRGTPMSEKNATLYRMILPEETCPFGVHAKELLEEHGYTIEEHILRSRDEVEAFEEKEGVPTTPQVFIGGERIGGSDDLERYLTA
jgi:glutaredoxin 3